MTGVPYASCKDSKDEVSNLVQQDIKANLKYWGLDTLVGSSEDVIKVLTQAVEKFIEGGIRQMKSGALSRPEGTAESELDHILIKQFQDVPTPQTLNV